MRRLNCAQQTFLEGLQLSLLAGRVFIKDLRYHSRNESIRVLKCHITWRYWLWRTQSSLEPANPNAENESLLSKSICPQIIKHVTNSLLQSPTEHLACLAEFMLASKGSRFSSTIALQRTTRSLTNSRTSKGQRQNKRQLPVVLLSENLKPGSEASRLTTPKCIELRG